MNTALQIAGKGLLLLKLLLFSLLLFRLLQRTFIFLLEILLLQSGRFETLLLADPAVRLLEPRRAVGLPPPVGFDASLQPVEYRLTFLGNLTALGKLLQRLLWMLLLKLMLLQKLLRMLLLLLVKVVVAQQLHLLLLLQRQLVVLRLLLLLLLQVKTVQVIGLISTRKYWESSRIHTDVGAGGFVVTPRRYACVHPQILR